MRIKNTHLLLVVVVLLPPGLAPAKDLSKTTSACARIDQSREVLSISYEGTRESDVRLRLRNNSDCSIRVETDSQEPLVLKGERWVSVHYLVHDRQKETLKAAYDWGHVVYSVEVGSGESILFRVPLAHFRRHEDVAVPFSFSWEKNVGAVGTVGGVKHLVYFLLDDLPSEVIRRKASHPPRHNKALQLTAR